MQRSEEGPVGDERAERIIELFALATGLPHEEQAAFLDAHCGADLALRAELASLLHHHALCDTAARAPLSTSGASSTSARSGFLAEPAAILPPPLRALTVGQRVGERYVIERQLAEGGMGVVYLAIQEAPVRRRVAVKLVRADLSRRDARLRFELERQALALMQHPNIAALFDAGITESRQPYVVMEYVDGEPLTTWARRTGPTIDARLDLFLTVCDAVRHAHQRGIMHRDLKPSNVLVEVSDGTPRAKVIDFGIARVIGEHVGPGGPNERGVERLDITNTRTFVGTPTYASPEQIDSPSSVDTRSDVYGLGAILYELLSGAPPFDPDRLASMTLTDLLRVVKEEEPAPPSARSTRPDDAARVRGDLDWITLKSLSKERDRRYESVGALAEDILRHRRDEPVLAGPPGMSYRIGKFVRRRRSAVAIVAVASLSLIVGGVVALWQANVAMQEAETAREVTAFLQDTFRAADPENARGEQVTIKDALDRAAPTVEERFAHRPLVLAALQWTIGNTYSAIGEYAEAERHLRSASELLELHRGPVHADTLQCFSDLAYSLKDAGELGQAERIARPQRAIALERQGTLGRQTLALTTTLGSILFERERHAESLELFREAHAGYRELFGERDRLTLMASTNLAVSMMNAGHPDEALPILERALPLAEEIHGVDHPRTLLTVRNLAAVLDRLGRHADALPHAERAYATSIRVLGSAHALTLSAGRNVVVMLMSLGRFGDAQRIARELVAAARAKLPASHRSTMGSVEILVTALGVDKKLKEAEEIALAFFAEVEGEAGTVATGTARAARLLVELYDEWGKAEEKARWTERVRAATPPDG